MKKISFITFTILLSSFQIVDRLGNLTQNVRYLHMMMSNALNWIEIPVIDMRRAKEFYSKVFDVKSIIEENVGGLNMAFLPCSVGDVGAALVKGEGRVPSQEGILPYLNMQTKEQLEAAVTIVTGIGGSVVTPIFDSGRWGWVSYILDTEGNKVALHAYNSRIPR